ncbi:MAG: hypothetical protein KGH88_01345 [Thaumarchaeota archaeon]|nr:hypothetical protein [Nitrososphaerota archaeon]
MSKMNEEDGLVVLEAHARDVGHGVAPIESLMMTESRQGILKGAESQV